MSLAWTHKFGDGQIEPTIGHLHAAEQLARKAGLREQLGLAKLELGVAYVSSGQLEQAESSLLESVEIYRELNQPPKILSCLHNLAIIHMESGEFEAAVTFLEEAYKANKAIGSYTGTYALATTQEMMCYLQVQPVLHQMIHMRRCQLLLQQR